MICYFCKKECLSPPSEQPTVWYCLDHPAAISHRCPGYIGSKAYCVSFKLFYHNQEYKISLYPVVVKTIIHKRVDAYFKSIVELSILANITPENCLQKIPTLLTFS